MVDRIQKTLIIIQKILIIRLALGNKICYNKKAVLKQTRLTYILSAYRLITYEEVI